LAAYTDKADEFFSKYFSLHQNVMVKTRFAPSPTGLLHIGNVRTALFNFLYAQQQQGTFLLRIEDTDSERSQSAFVTALLEDLQWLGLHWQEGPFYQSQRQSIYDDYYQKLIEKDLAYPCYCSDTELKLSRQAQINAGLPPRYAGTCAQLTPAQRQAREDAGKVPSLRFRVPKNFLLTLEDGVKGSLRYQSDDIGDFIIRRSDGTPAFFFCNAIDDAVMGVSDAFRGEDHLTNTPRQVFILQALDLPIPRYHHISLIVAANGAPLSKRLGAQSIQELRDSGYLPIAVNNYLARLGHSYSEDGLLTTAQLAAEFSTARLGSAPARHNLDQLLHYQKLAVLALSDCERESWLSGIKSAVPEGQWADFLHAIKDNISLPAEAKAFADMLFTDTWSFKADAYETIYSAGADFFAKAQQHLDASCNFKALVEKVKQDTGAKGKALFMPLRVALTGETHGPELPLLLPLIGEARARARLQMAESIAREPITKD
jgi:glutamyl-tRNA synthetase